MVHAALPIGGFILDAMALADDFFSALLDLPEDPGSPDTALFAAGPAAGPANPIVPTSTSPTRLDGALYSDIVPGARIAVDVRPRDGYSTHYTFYTVGKKNQDRAGSDVWTIYEVESSTPEPDDPAVIVKYLRGKVATSEHPRTPDWGTRKGKAKRLVYTNGALGIPSIKNSTLTIYRYDEGTTYYDCNDWGDP